MFPPGANTDAIKTTSYKAVLPFYAYAALSFLVATVLMLFSAGQFSGHYFQPHTLAITHIMALGWGTMIILGASHQLVPVIIEGKLHSERLAYASFALAALGIPLLVRGFFIFDMGGPAQWGGILVVLAIGVYFVNLGLSIAKSKTENIQAIYIFTATAWLLLTSILGLALLYNFSIPLFSKDSLHYLPLHAHLGIIGWFLLLIIGVGSKLIPMFLISKYSHTKLIWWIYVCINTALLSYIFLFYFSNNTTLLLLPVIVLFAGIALFAKYIYQAIRERLRRQIDDPMKISISAVLMMGIPILLLILAIGLLSFIAKANMSLILAYGFLIFFGWLTAIILGMTFKTLPFIVWNKVYHRRSAMGKTPTPKDLFNHTIFKFMGIIYIAGLLVFTIGILSHFVLLLKIGAALLVIAAFLYNINVFKIITHQPVEK
ncbi:MAG: cytochrome C oxidase subunit I [Saprospiraceae bacterium]|jgi:hypothetical protein|nr:cytochrome C oxidase subunit I [Saprospiraceae bacterium]